MDRFRILYGWYDLEEGEELRILDRGDSIYRCPLEYGPDKIVVKKEYPLFIQLKAIYYGDDEASYDFCINKADLLCGHSVVKRVKNNKLLRPEVPQAA